MRQVRLAVLLVLAVTPAARAGTVTVQIVNGVEGHMTEPSWREVDYVAASGEANAVTVSLTGDAVDLRDDGAPVTAPAECTRVDDHEVRCPAGRIAGSYAGGRFFDARVDLGDGDDRLTATGAGSGVRTDGGPGDDVLVTDAGPDVLRGGPGADTLAAGTGDDEIVDAGRPGEVDRYDGGAGVDVLRHSGSSPWTVDLAASTASNGDETDTVAGIERVDGGAGPDTLLGSDAADVLYGHGGADRLDGRGGDDVLGANVTRGFGDVEREFFSWPDGRADRVACGTGTDVVDGPDPRDAPSGCEALGSERDTIAFAGAVAVGRAAVSLRVLSLSGGARPRITVLAGRTVVGRAIARRPGALRVRATRRGRALLARGGPVRLTVVASQPMLDDSGETVARQRLGFRATVR